MEKKLSTGAQPRTSSSPDLGRVNSPVLTPRDDMFSSGKGPLDALAKRDLERIAVLSEFAGFQFKTT